MTIACDPFWAWALLIAASIPLAAYGLAMLALVRCEDVRVLGRGEL